MGISPEEAEPFLKRGSSKRRSVKIVEKVLYSNMLKDRNGYVVDKECMPPPYELVKLKLKNNKSAYGWWTGCEWEGRWVKSGDVKMWKRKGFVN